VPKLAHRINTFLKPFLALFKVMVLKSGETMWFGMGVVFEDYNINKMPGWKDGTVGYHTDDRKIFDKKAFKYGRKTTGKASSNLVKASLTRKNPLAAILLETYLF